MAIQELLGVEREPLEPLRPEDAPDAQLLPQTEEQAGAWSGPYEAGSVWAVLDGSGHGDGQHGCQRERTSRERTLSVERPGAYQLVEHERHTRGVLTLEVGTGVECLATCFTPGVA